MYKCVIWSDSSNSREYETTTRSAAKAAMLYGRCEGGEVVQVQTMTTGRVLSEARWTPEDGGKYIRCAVD